MLKKLDWYTIKTFFGPFLFIFSVLFFIFMVQFAWQEMDKFAGKGLSFFDIAKLLFYSGLVLIQFVMPLTILLSSIMAFGGFGERYELAAMKSTGISLGRIMLPLFILISILSFGLYIFSDTVVPLSQKKAKNMLYNIVSTQPAINLESGVFIMGLPGLNMKIDNNYGENGEFLEGVFIHVDANAYEDQRTIIADKGTIVPADDKRFLRLALYNGYIYDDEIKGLNRQKLKRQPMRQVKFDTLVNYIDVSDIIENKIDKENVTDHYKFLNSKQLMGRIDTVNLNNDSIYHNIYIERVVSILPSFNNDTTTLSVTQDLSNIHLKSFNAYDKADKEEAVVSTIRDIDRDLQMYETNKNEINGRNKFLARHVLILVRNYSNSIMCIVFFLIGAPLGAIIRKGGIGMPVVVAIIIFILFYIIYMYTENLAKNGEMNPYFAAWSPVLFFFPLGIFFSYKAVKDSEIFNIESYLKPFQKVFSIFGNKKKEHARYQ